jgi:hypothetical protein
VNRKGAKGRFREDSVKIQGRFSEHSVIIHGPGNQCGPRVCSGDGSQCSHVDSSPEVNVPSIKGFSLYTTLTLLIMLKLTRLMNYSEMTACTSELTACTSEMIVCTSEMTACTCKTTACTNEITAWGYWGGRGTGATVAGGLERMGSGSGDGH